MKANIGSIDRSIRIIAGLALITLAATGIIGPWGYLGVVALLTASVRFCPAYLPLGINTCSAGKKE
ncbi:MAG: DUF2892 domain-containing protein [Betaproteobacteria bacterium]